MSLRTTFFALTYDRQMAGTERAGLRAFRERLLAGAHGDVLEIGGGTGANLPCYGPDVTSLTITEPQPAMLRRLQRRIGEHPAGEHWPSARVLRAPAEDLPFGDHSFGMAVSTLVLCGVDDQPRALRELRRVLRPGGQLLFIEHLRSADPALARLQDRMNWLNRLVVCCDCNRPTLDSVRQAGFTITQVEHTTLPKAPKFVAPAIVGSATVPAAAPSGSTPPAGTSRPSSPDDQRPGRVHGGPAVGPRLYRLELRGQADEAGLVAEARSAPVTAASQGGHGLRRLCRRDAGTARPTPGPVTVKVSGSPGLLI